MDIDDRRKLGLLTVDADRELLRAIVKNDLYGVSTWLRGVRTSTRETRTVARRCSTP